MWTRKLYKPHFRIVTFLYHMGSSRKLRHSSSPKWLDLVQYIKKKNKATKFLEKHHISVDSFPCLLIISASPNSHLAWRWLKLSCTLNCTPLLQIYLCSLRFSVVLDQLCPNVRHSHLNGSFTVQVEVKWQGSNVLLVEATSHKKKKRQKIKKSFVRKIIIVKPEVAKHDLSYSKVRAEPGSTLINNWAPLGSISVSAWAEKQDFKQVSITVHLHFCTSDISFLDSG